MLRIWFTGEDLARTRLIPSAGPLAEVGFSLVSLHGRRHPEWRRRTLARLPNKVRPVLGLYPGGGQVVDLLSVTGPTGLMEEAADRLMRVPRQRLDVEVADVVRRAGRGAAATARLIGHSLDERRRLTGLLSHYYKVALQPYWERLDQLGNRQHALVAHTMVSAGVSAALGELSSPDIDWQPPVLQINPHSSDDTCVRGDHHLGGRGLIITWSVFDPPWPKLFVDPTESTPDLLVCPTGTAAGVQLVDEGTARRLDSVAALVGSARARVLTAAATRRSTSSLAHQAGLSVASASRHTAVLREAGLLTSERIGASVYHCLTALGEALLDRQAITPRGNCRPPTVSSRS